MNCDALRPAVTKTVVFLSNFAASRNRLLFKPPHKPRSELTTMTARFFTSRAFISGCSNPAMRGAASARIAFINSAYGRPMSAACCACVADGFFSANLQQQIRFASAEKIRELRLEIFDFVHGHVVEEIILRRPQHRRLHFDGQRIELRLLENFHDALAAFENRLCLRVEVRTELRERRELTVLSQVTFDTTCD